ncbi:MAG: bifunctional biotin--[acetyl-CoA-carboxylase] ligase/biotin operon repressor BirA [Methylomarinum sp.]|nr:bifunctional biotin--[acetyl-CoA-carboxylase] ligase/biotin operon repressor BirA [Methylomarinum sp.]
MLISSSQKKILNRLADGQFHSGTELAKSIGISRSAVCKQLNNLTELGIAFSAVSGKGYRLEFPIQLLSEAEIMPSLNTNVAALISELEIHDCINSTNSYLVDKSHACQQSGVVCFSEHQTSGKGRRGREWVSPFGSNIYLSILWQFQNGPASISGLSLAVGVAVIRALNDCGIDDVGLKWPNDIYWKERKLAGILIEVSGETEGPCNAVIGLGLNCYLPEEKAKSITQDWVDLNQILNDNSAKIRNKLAATLLNHSIPTIANFEQDTLSHYIDAWRSYDCMKGKDVNIYMGSNVFSGRVEGIDNNGLLLLADEQGQVKAFASGEVSFRQS